MNNLSAMMAFMTEPFLSQGNESVEITCLSVKNPWYDYNIPKAMRKGKTLDEINALRKELWKKSAEQEKKTSFGDDGK
jgi:hypothetical protein